LRRSLTWWACVRMHVPGLCTRSSAAKDQGRKGYCESSPRGLTGCLVPDPQHACDEETGLDHAGISCCACFRSVMILADGCCEAHLGQQYLLWSIFQVGE